VLMKHEEALDPADYDMVGVLGKLSMPIRAGGIGELIRCRCGREEVDILRASLDQSVRLHGVSTG